MIVVYSFNPICDSIRCILFPSSLIIVFLYKCCQEMLCVLEGIKINIFGVVFAKEWCVFLRGSRSSLLVCVACNLGLIT